MRYGVEQDGVSYYAYQETNGSIYCSNAIFGNPINVVKECAYLSIAGADYDGDGVTDRNDLPRNSAEAYDSDGDGIGDNSDPFTDDADNRATDNWIRCASEWGMCTPPAPAVIRYGVVWEGQPYYVYLTSAEPLLHQSGLR